MYASFIIAFHTERIDNLLQTLRFLEKDHAEVIKKSQLILVCQNYSPEIDNGFYDYKHYNLELNCMQLPRLTNRGVEAADSETIVLLESDRILPAGYFTDIIDAMKPGIMVTTQRMFKLDSPASDNGITKGLAMAQQRHVDPVSVAKLPFEFHEEHRSKINELGRRTCFSGNTTVNKADYVKVGGMDETYQGYGWMDNDMNNTMLKAKVQPIFKEEVELHLWHTQATYGLVDESNSFSRNGIYYCKKWNVERPQWLQERIANKSRVML